MPLGRVHRTSVIDGLAIQTINPARRSDLNGAGPRNPRRRYWGELQVKLDASLILPVPW